MIDTIKNVAILGSSGTMGNLIGGIIAQQGIKVYFLSRTLEGARFGLQRAIAQARSEVISRNVVCGDYDHLLESALEEADWIVECVTEKLGIKQSIYEKIERYKRPDAIVSSTTSSLPLTKLTERRSEDFKRNFLSTHFYNPPGKMLACEIASQRDTDPEVLRFIGDFLANELGRVVIPVRDIAGFAGNRIAFLLFSRITALAQEYGVEMMDYLIGPYTGRVMPPLTTLDLVGLDIHKAIIGSLYENTNDEKHECFILPDYINKMINNGCLGNKTPRKGGFYKKAESGEFVFLDPATCDYTAAIEPHVAFVEKSKHLIHMGMYQEAFDAIKTACCREADIVMDTLCTYVAYSYGRVGEVTDYEFGIDGICKVMSFGFNWAPPSLIVSMLGGKEYVIELLDKKGFEVPEALKSESERAGRIANSGKYFVAR
ncbi:MAG: 3-hydroxyacyl-CoA dehydrogenase family protein [Planctomycetes bacterium]|nr:3-hydroxyacyl-CoA dehydrogenase family protein [Planctomycetota bacterium]